ncbi:MAG: DNA modification methylase [Holosporales bacterium]|jgi:DNA modification methylase|nr:DNA modification methylase [Holosporales bacterium]
MKNLEIFYKNINELHEYESNPRRNDEVVDRMVDCIREFGFRIPIVAKSDGEIVDGHLRFKAAKAMGLTEVPVILADELSEAQVKAFRLVANQSANWAEFDAELLKIELEDLKNLDFDLNLTGFDFDEIQELLGEEEPLEENFSDFKEVAETKKPTVSKLGDLWILGDHRLLCGDSLDPQSYETLMQGQTADITVTDPPYNVNVRVNKNPDREEILGGYKEIANDKLGKDFQAFLDTVCDQILSRTRGAIYVFMAVNQLTTLQSAFEKFGGHIENWLVWAKGHFAVGKTHYHHQFEPILYGWNKGCRDYRHPFWCGDTTQSDVWNVAKNDSNPLHPTMKPVALIERAIKNSSQKGDSVLDPFGGSGTTLIAAEHLDRKAFLVELEPRYVDVTIQRWQNLTGKQAILERTGESFDDLQETAKHAVDGLSEHNHCGAAAC